MAWHHQAWALGEGGKGGGEEGEACYLLPFTWLPPCAFTQHALIWNLAYPLPLPWGTWWRACCCLLLGWEGCFASEGHITALLAFLGLRQSSCCALFSLLSVIVACRDEPHQTGE